MSCRSDGLCPQTRDRIAPWLNSDAVSHPYIITYVTLRIIPFRCIAAIIDI